MKNFKWIFALCLVAMRVSAASDLSPFLGVNYNSDYAVLVWTHETTAENTIQASTYTTGGGWTGLTTISNTGYDSWAPVVSVNASGNAIALWQFYDTGSDIISLAGAYLPNGGSWGTATTISGSEDVVEWDRITGNVSHTIYLSDTGNITASWSAYTTNGHKVFATTSTTSSWPSYTSVQITP